MPIRKLVQDGSRTKAANVRVLGRWHGLAAARAFLFAADLLSSGALMRQYPESSKQSSTERVGTSMRVN